jgi:hypothetical protein
VSSEMAADPSFPSTRYNGGSTFPTPDCRGGEGVLGDLGVYGSLQVSVGSRGVSYGGSLAVSAIDIVWAP